MSTLLTEFTIKHSNLIYDVGMNKGEETDFYLKKGFRVIGFEANPNLTESCRKRIKLAVRELPVKRV